MTQKQTIATIKAIPGMTAKRTQYGEYRVNFAGGDEATAYYTDSGDDAIGTARLMSNTRCTCGEGNSNGLAHCEGCNRHTGDYCEVSTYPYFRQAFDGHIFVVKRVPLSCDCVVTNEYGCQTRLNYARFQQIAAGKAY